MKPLGITVFSNFYPEPGAEIATVVPNSAAQRAGLIAGDVIISVNERRTNDASDAHAIVSSACGTTASFTYIRPNPTPRRLFISTPLPPGFGCLGVGMKDGVTRYPVLEVVEVEPQSVAHAAGLQPGDWLKYANGQILFGDISVLANFLRTEPGGPPSLILNVYRPSNGQILNPEISLSSAGARATGTPEDLALLTTQAVLAVQRIIKNSGIDTQTESGVWDEATSVGLGRVLKELQQDEVWGLGWSGPSDGVFTAALRDHLKLTQEALQELEADKETTDLMGPLLDALDFLLSRGVLPTVEP